jgi:hypothetical protein
VFQADVRAVVTYAVIDAATGTMLSSHPSLDAARADAVVETDERTESVAIYVFDDTGHVTGECVGADC